MDTLTFRGVVRGNDKTGKRVRRVRNIEAPSFEMAWLSFGELHAEMSKGLRDTSASVLPPVGFKINGEPSKGYELAA
jgi:hypothetical protein